MLFKWLSFCVNLTVILPMWDYYLYKTRIARVPLMAHKHSERARARSMTDVNPHKMVPNGKGKFQRKQYAVWALVHSGTYSF
jgi:hypothetical protein